MTLDPGTTKNDEGRSFPFSALPRLEAVLRKQREMTTKLEDSRAGSCMTFGERLFGISNAPASRARSR